MQLEPSRRWLRSCGLTIIALACLVAVDSRAAEKRSTDSAGAFRPDLPRNTWVQVEPESLPFVGGGSHRPQSWNKLVYDSVGRRAIYLDRWSDETHGHTIYANAVLAFDPAANSVACLKVSNWTQQRKEGGGYHTVPLPENEREPTPCDRHPYGNVAFVPEQNAVYLSAGANQSALAGELRSHAACRDTWRFDLAGRRWTKVASDLEPPDSLEGVMCYDPANKVIVRLCNDGTQTWLLDVTKGQWRNAEAENNPRCGKAAAMCYDSKRGRIILFGGRGRDNPLRVWNAPGVQTWSYSVAEHQWQPLPDAPIAGRAAGMDYDPSRDCVVLHFSLEKGKPGRTLFYLCDKNQWRALPERADAAGPPAPWHGLAYDATRDVFIRASYSPESRSTCQWWLLRPELSETVEAEPTAANPADNP